MCKTSKIEGEKKGNHKIHTVNNWQLQLTLCRSHDVSHSKEIHTVRQGEKLIIF